MDVHNLTIGNNTGEGTVEYTYTFEDEGGDPTVDGNRTLHVLCQCQFTEVLDPKGMKITPFNLYIQI